MAWPPPVLPTTRNNTTVMADTHPSDHNAVNLAVNDTVAWVKPGAWTALTLQNGWTNQGGTFQPAQQRKVGDLIHVRGVIKPGALNGVVFAVSGAPPYDIRQPVSDGGLMVVTQSGSVVLYAASGTLFGFNFEFSTVG